MRGEGGVSVEVIQYSTTPSGGAVAAAAVISSHPLPIHNSIPLSTHQIITPLHFRRSNYHSAMEDSALPLALNKVEESLKKLAGSRVRFQKTNAPGIFCSRLPPHWRSNKSLQFPFAIISLRPLPDGTKVAVYAGNEENCGADVKNNTAEFVSQLARFSDLRFVGKSGRGKSFNLTITIYTEPMQQVATVPNAIKVTVDGPRDSRNPAKQLLMNELDGCLTLPSSATTVAAAAAYRRFRPMNLPSTTACTAMFKPPTQFMPSSIRNLAAVPYQASELRGRISAGGIASHMGVGSACSVPPAIASSSRAELVGREGYPTASPSQNVLPSPTQSPASPLLAEFVRLYAISALVSNLFTNPGVNQTPDGGVTPVGMPGTKLSASMPAISFSDHSPTSTSNTSRGSDESWEGRNGGANARSTGGTKRRHGSMEEAGSQEVKKMCMPVEKGLWRPYDPYDTGTK